jgi:hypothetical protein
MMTNFTEACEAAKNQVKLDGCVVHIRAVIEVMLVPDGTGIEHRVAGYLLSDWHDGSVVATFK